MMFWRKFPTWTVAVFTVVMGVSALILLVGIRAGGAFYGADPVVFWLAMWWTGLGTAELVRRTRPDPPPKEESTRYWP